MKKLFLLLAIAMLPLTGMSKARQVKTPPVTLSFSPFAEIGSVTLTDTSTVIVMKAFTSPGAWISMPKSAFLQAGDKSYTVKSSKDLILEEPFYLPESGRAEFTLYFEPLPAGTERFDLIDSLGRYGFTFCGVELTGKLPPLTLDPKVASQKYDHATPMPQAIMKAGKTRLKGRILDYHPLFTDMYAVATSRGLMGNRVEIPLNPKDDGTFDIEFDVPHTSKITLETPQNDFAMVVTPGETVEMVINNREIERASSKLRNKTESYGKQIYYVTGAWATFNDELMNTKPMQILPENLNEAILGMDINQYRDYILGLAAQGRKEINSSKLHSDNMKKWLNLSIDLSTLNMISLTHQILEYAYRQANKLDYRAPLTGFTPLAKPTLDYYAPLKELNLDTHLAQIYQQSIDIATGMRNIINNFDPIAFDNVLRYIEQSEQATAEEKQCVKEFNELSTKENYEKLKPIFVKYSDLIAEQTKQTPKIGVSDILTTDQGYIADYIFTLPHAYQLEQMQPLSIEQMSQLYAQVKNPVIMEALSNANDKLLAKIEQSKLKTGYTIIDVSDIAPDQLLQSIIDRHKGKVLFIDFWATWCGPCRNAMTQAEPVKEYFKDKDVVFIYLTNASSPDAAWRTMIADIPGEHYMLNQEQDKYMANTEYQYQGIPSYAIIGRDGQKKHFQTGFMGAPNMKQKIEELLAQ